jgi:hypothetical protein
LTLISAEQLEIRVSRKIHEFIVSTYLSSTIQSFKFDCSEWLRSDSIYIGVFNWKIPLIFEMFRLGPKSGQT